MVPSTKGLTHTQKLVEQQQHQQRRFDIQIVLVHAPRFHGQDVLWLYLLTCSAKKGPTVDSYTIQINSGAYSIWYIYMCSKPCGLNIWVGYGFQETSESCYLPVILVITIAALNVTLVSPILAVSMFNDQHPLRWWRKIQRARQREERKGRRQREAQKGQEAKGATQDVPEVCSFNGLGRLM